MQFDIWEFNKKKKKKRQAISIFIFEQLSYHIT
jgi:hypothetical protein